MDFDWISLPKLALIILGASGISVSIEMFLLWMVMP